MAMGPAVRDFPPDEADLTQEYWMDCKENRQSVVEKAPLIGRIDGVQTGPLLWSGL